MNRVIDELNVIMNETMKYDFPFLASKEKKSVIIAEKKKYIENRVDEAIGKYSPGIRIEYDSLWEEAEKKAAEQFDSLPDKVKINGFYLQELTHTYVERILEKIKAES